VPRLPIGISQAGETRGRNAPTEQGSAESRESPFVKASSLAKLWRADYYTKSQRGDALSADQIGRVVEVFFPRRFQRAHSKLPAHSFRAPYKRSAPQHTLSSSLTRSAPLTHTAPSSVLHTQRSTHIISTRERTLIASLNTLRAPSSAFLGEFTRATHPDCYTVGHSASLSATHALITSSTQGSTHRSALQSARFLLYSHAPGSASLGLSTRATHPDCDTARLSAPLSATHALIAQRSTHIISAP
jgi:hypothetical protein